MALPRSLPPSLESQKEEIRRLLCQRLDIGDTWWVQFYAAVCVVRALFRYLIDVRWMKQWKKYCGYETWDQSYAGESSYFPGPIETENLYAGTYMYIPCTLHAKA